MWIFAVIIHDYSQSIMQNSFHDPFPSFKVVLELYSLQKLLQFSTWIGHIESLDFQNFLHNF